MLFKFQEEKFKTGDGITLNQILSKAKAFGEEHFGKDCFSNATITTIKDGVEHHLDGGDITFKANRTENGIIFSILINPIDNDALYNDED